MAVKYKHGLFALINRTLRLETSRKGAEKQNKNKGSYLGSHWFLIKYSSIVHQYYLMSPAWASLTMLGRK